MRCGRYKAISSHATDTLSSMSEICGGRRPARSNPALRSRQCHADTIQGTVEAQGLGDRHRQAFEHAQRTDRTCPPSGDHHACHAQARHRVQTDLTQGPENRRPIRASEREQRPREGADDGADSVARGQSPRPTAVSTMPLSHPAYPIKCHSSTQRTQAPEGSIRLKPSSQTLTN